MEVTNGFAAYIRGSDAHPGPQSTPRLGSVSELGDSHPALEVPGFVGQAWCSEPRPTPHPDMAAELAALGEAAVPARRHAFLLGRRAAHQALASIGADRGPILIGPDRRPLWPWRIVGSIAHTARTAVALVADARLSAGIGVDIERLRPAPELYEQVLRPDEREWVDEVPDRDRFRAVFSVFSAKETIFKAFHHRVGRLFGFDAASLAPAEDGFSARLVTGVDPAYTPDDAFDVACRWWGDIVVTWLVLPAEEGSR